LDSQIQKEPSATPETMIEMALVTGASSGLGAEFARQLASQGYNLILAARRLDRLQDLAELLQSKYSIYCQVYQADLSKINDIERLVSIIQSVPPLNLLVNSAGFGTVGRFYRVDPDKEIAMMNVHMTSSVMLCRAALPRMITQNYGAIINVTSMAGLIPIRNVLYHSTKAFLISFSEALHAELHGSNVRVQALCPGFVLTEFHDTSEYTQFSRSSIPGFLWMTPAQVVTASLKSLNQDKLICIPGAIYRFAGMLARNSISASLIKTIAQYILYHRKGPSV
jgi:short-subunit dehydrogenase